MDAQELRNLQEAYLEVVENQQLDEAGKNDARIRDNIARFSGKKGIEYTPPSNWSQSENRGKGATISSKQTEKRRRKELAKSAMGEEFDIYDIILSHLLDEGYAETPEAAEAIMVHMSEEWREDIVEVSLSTSKNAYNARREREEMEPSNPRNQTKSGEEKSSQTFRRVRKKYGHRVAKNMRDEEPYNQRNRMDAY